jgi:hypothetical protein
LAHVRFADHSMITLMYVVGKLAREHRYVSGPDLYPTCNTGGPGYVPTDRYCKIA